MTAAYETLIVETHETTRLIRLNRPQALNALNAQLTAELSAALQAAEDDAAIHCIVITGSERAFAAGADIKEMASKSYADVYGEDFITKNWERVTTCRKPVIQRLTRFIGKAKAMDMVLTGRMMDVAEAERCGLVSRVVPTDKLIEEALAAAKTIGAMSLNAVMLTKEMVNAAYEPPLAPGVKLERRLFHSLFAFEDQKEGMAAFIEKRKPVFKGK